MVVRLFILEGLALGVVAATTGIVLGAAGVLYYGARGIPMNTMTLAWVAGGDHLFPVLTPANVARAALAIAGLSTARRHLPGASPPAAWSRGKRCTTSRRSTCSSSLPSPRPRPLRPPTQILRRADRAVLGETAAYTLQMTVVRPGKPERVVEMKGWKKGDALGLVRYTAPAKERGTAYLRNGGNTWLYLPERGEGRARGGEAELRRRRLLERGHLPALPRRTTTCRRWRGRRRGKASPATGST